MYIRKEPKANLENKRRVFLEIGFILTLLIVFAAFQYRSYETNTIDLPPDHSSEEIEELVQIIKEKLCVCSRGLLLVLFLYTYFLVLWPA